MVICKYHFKKNLVLRGEEFKYCLDGFFFSFEFFAFEKLQGEKQMIIEEC